MENYIAGAILLLIAAFGVFHTVKHFKGEGGCCGGGGYRPRRKRLAEVKYKKRFRVRGMHCEHCKRRVEEAVNDLPSVRGSVQLKSGVLTVSYAAELSDEAICEKLSRIGYSIEAMD